jgi:glycosyltransferase involved in cell wall biosynthesis
LPTPLLSAALIVRNEERFLETCLRSLGPHVDEIVVVDTGSTDRSRAIARDLGARVLDYRWHDNFAAARNASIAAARGTWILAIDADERVSRFDRCAVEGLLADPVHVCYSVSLCPARGYTRYRENRLFRRRPDLVYRGVIHESLAASLAALCERGKFALGHSPIALEHDGYDGDVQHKHARNLPLLRARLAAEPVHVHSWSHLGATLLALGDETGAEAAWRQGIAVVRAQMNNAAADGIPFVHLATLLLDTKRDAGALLKEACQLFPDNYSLIWLWGRSLVRTDRCAEAMLLFERLATIDADGLDGALAYDRTIFGAGAHAALGLCGLRLGRYAESAAHYGRAEALAPGNLEYRAKRLLAESKLRRA